MNPLQLSPNCNAVLHLHPLPQAHPGLELSAVTQGKYLLQQITWLNMSSGRRRTNKQINKTCHVCDKSVARSADPGPKYFATTRPLSDSFGGWHEIGHLRAELMQCKFTENFYERVKDELAKGGVRGEAADNDDDDGWRPNGQDRKN